MKIAPWIVALGSFLLGVAATLLAAFGFRKASPTKADAIVAAADAEKARIASEIKADTDAQLAARFNSLADGGKK
jgi:hypothetical protein